MGRVITSRAAGTTARERTAAPVQGSVEGTGGISRASCGPVTAEADIGQAPAKRGPDNCA